MKRFVLFISLIFLFLINNSWKLYAQGNSFQIRIASYNVWYNPNLTPDFIERLPYFRTIMDSISPDILAIVEVTNDSAIYKFRDSVLNYNNTSYTLGTFIPNTRGDLPITSNAIYFKSNKFQFLTNQVIQTNLRDINRFSLRHIITNHIIDIYVAHLKSGNSTANETTRKNELSNIFPVIDQVGTYKYIFVGDLNFYNTIGVDYQSLTVDNPGYFIDPENPPPVNTGITWNNEAYSNLHTISTRKSTDWPYISASYNSTGMTERFDYFFLSPGIYGGNDSLKYNTDSFKAFEQDGTHYKQSIIPGSSLDSALFFASDHLPVYATFDFVGAVPVELVSFTAQYVKKIVQLYWNTATEVMNYGFDIERSVNDGEWNKIGFVNGFGNSNVPHDYTFEDANTDVPGHYKYRLKQIDTDGKFEYSPIAQTEVYGPDNYSLSENYPNPFNPTTSIDFQLPVDSKVTLEVLDVLGREVATLADGQMAAGKHKVIFDGSSLSSGIYVYQLRTNNKLLTRKMMLLK